MGIEWVRKIQNLLKDGLVLVLVTVVKTRGSTPCGSGSKLLSFYETENSQYPTLWGSIGGGMIEYEVCQYAKKMLEKFRYQSIAYHLHQHTYHVHAESGQCCGGEVVISFEFITAKYPHREWIDNLIACYHQQQDVYIFSIRIGNENTFKQACSERMLASLQSQVSELLDSSNSEKGFIQQVSKKIKAIKGKHHQGFCLHDANKDMVIAVEKISYSQIQSVCLFGSGHIARALVPIISSLPIKVYWVDDRASEFELFSHNHAYYSADNVHILCQDFLSLDIPKNAYCLVITYSHKKDYEICKHILSTSQPSYLGLIGSRTKAKRFYKFLQEESVVNENAIEQLQCPIGEKYQTQKSPVAIAISIASHLLKKIDDNIASST